MEGANIFLRLQIYIAWLALLVYVSNFLGRLSVGVWGTGLNPFVAPMNVIFTVRFRLDKKPTDFETLLIKAWAS